MILDWSLMHTFYTQSLCNLLFYISENQLSIETVKFACAELLKRNEPVFYQYRQLLTPAQWNFLIAIAKEGKVKQLTAQKFISQYEIGTPANARRISRHCLTRNYCLNYKLKKKPLTAFMMYSCHAGLKMNIDCEFIGFRTISFHSKSKFIDKNQYPLIKFCSFELITLTDKQHVKDCFWNKKYSR